MTNLSTFCTHLLCFFAILSTRWFQKVGGGEGRLLESVYYKQYGMFEKLPAQSKSYPPRACRRVLCTALDHQLCLNLLTLSLTHPLREPLIIFSFDCE